MTGERASTFRSLSAALLLSFLVAAPGLAAPGDDKPRVPWDMDESYTGPNDASFQKLRYEVPTLIRQSMIDMAVRLGLDFRDGWVYPMTVRFVDEGPHGTESTLAYVAFGDDENGKPHQYLNINLTAYAQQGFDFDKVFSHELVHAMMNDALDFDGSRNLPVWLHEGLAVYGADQGEQMMRAYVNRYDDPDPSMFLTGLESPHNAMHYLEDYLAIKYIHDRHGVNSLHNFVHEVIRRKGDIPGALEYTCFENWTDFQQNARKFSEDEITQIARDKHETADHPY